ncbi:MAG: pseudaminic acid synthase [Lachnospiraceae bacterium]|nr:pseudaminic acid synthase [Lachnospiraceae bacterium]
MIKYKDMIENGKVYIIAEMSANHAGKKDLAYEIIEKAAEAGADCVKIQTYTADTLTIDCDAEPYRIHGGLWDGYNYYKLYQEAMTPWEWQADLKKKCERCGVDFLSTPFDNTAVDFLEEIGIEFYKIASFELVDIPLIEYVASKHKPIIMSVGMGSLEEIQDALEACYRHDNHDVTLLKCCSQYPAQFEDMNLATIPDMRRRFGVNVGLSDHSPGSLGPVIATALGAVVIEKHVCLGHEIETPDSGFSMTMDEFAQMVQDVRDTETVLGKATYDLTVHEKSGLKFRRSLVAVQDIAEGEVFTKDNVRSIRPAVGIKPKYYDEIIGKKSKKAYRFGEGIDKKETGSK